jgi:hypothetical protein
MGADDKGRAVPVDAAHLYVHMWKAFVPGPVARARGPADPPPDLLGGKAGHRTIADVPFETCLTAPRCSAAQADLAWTRVQARFCRKASANL